jgi:hypothetical protein
VDPGLINASATARWNLILAVTEDRLWAAERFNAVPFFRSRHYEINLDYVGHAKQ